MLKADKDEKEINTIEIDITEMEINERNNLQEILKMKFYVHEPVYVGDKLILKICRLQDEKECQNASSDYIQFVLHTDKICTTQAIDVIAKTLRYFLSNFFLNDMFMPFLVGN